jgi:hypothetical protein
MTQDTRKNTSRRKQVQLVGRPKRKVVGAMYTLSQCIGYKQPDAKKRETTK